MYVDSGCRSGANVREARTNNSRTDDNNRRATRWDHGAARSMAARDLRIGMVHGDTTVMSWESNEQW